MYDNDEIGKRAKELDVRESKIQYRGAAIIKTLNDAAYELRRALEDTNEWPIVDAYVDTRDDTVANEPSTLETMTDLHTRLQTITDELIMATTNC